MIRRLLVLLGLMFALVPIQAQDLSDDELMLLDDITQGLETTLALDTYSFAGEQVIAQDITAQGQNIQQEIVQNLEATYLNDGDVQYSYLILEQLIMQTVLGTDTIIELTQEVLTNKEGLFIRFSDFDTDMFDGFYPEEWVLLSDASSEYVGLAAINAEQFENILDAQQTTVPFLGFTDAILKIATDDRIEINDQEMAVYLMEIDPTILMNDDYVDEATSVLNLDALGFISDDLGLTIADGATVNYTFYIGQEDGYLHRIESTVVMDITMNGAALGLPGDLEIAQNLSHTFDYGDFNAPVKLPTP